MTSRSLAFAMQLVRCWTRVYTLGMPAHIRNARIGEIESDLWECQHDLDRQPRAVAIVTRLLLGIPDDLLWRFEQRVDASEPSIAMMPSRVTTSALTCSFVVHVVALACAAWWASVPRDNSPSGWTSQVPGAGGPALIAASLAVSESQHPQKHAASEKDHAMKRAATFIGTIVTTITLPVVAQQPTTDPAFDAASVRANTSGYAGWNLEPQPGGRLTGTNVPAAALIRFAYDLPDFQVSGGPGWLNSARFDVAAKAEGDPPLDEKRWMLRTLLAERFKLTAHTERRELPIYALVMARSDGRPGPQLRRSEADCGPADSVPELGVGGVPSRGSCGYFGFAPDTDLPKGRGGLAFRGMTLAMFAKRLMPVVRRAVIDQTGLSGYFDGDFDFLAELPPPPPPPGLPSSFGPDPFASVFTVLPEQLGLKLESRRGPVEVLVIDRIEPPARE